MMNNLLKPIIKLKGIKHTASIKSPWFKKYSLIILNSKVKVPYMYLAVKN